MNFLCSTLKGVHGFVSGKGPEATRSKVPRNINRILPGQAK